MIRVMRAKLADLPVDWQGVVLNLPAYLKSLPISQEARSLIANAEIDGEYINFYSPFNGTVEKNPVVNGEVHFRKDDGHSSYLFLERREQVLKAVLPHLQEQENELKAQSNNNNKNIIELAPSPALLTKIILSHPQHVFMVDGGNPVVVPLFDKQHLDAMSALDPYLKSAFIPAIGVVPAAASSLNAASANANAPSNSAPLAAAPAAASSRAWLWGLLALLLLLGLAALYYFKFYPWPFVDEKANAKDDLAALEQTLALDEQNLKEIEALIDKAQLREELADSLAKQQSLNDLLATLNKDRENLNEINALLAKINTAEQEADKLIAEQNQAQLAEKKEPVTVDPVKVEATAKKLPKCSTIIKEGKVPKLIIATDGSGSMLEHLSDGTRRIDAAIKAAHSLVDSVDKNVPIELIGIHGCPLAKEYGTFGGNERAALKNAISQTDPRTMRGFYMLHSVPTPLVSGMRAMAGSVSSKVDAVGILISDGVDTCQQTQYLDICEVARDIHQQRPKLKINVILIGDDAPNATCVAKITGGKVYRPGDSKKLVSDLKKAGSTLQKVCE